MQKPKNQLRKNVIRLLIATVSIQFLLVFLVFATYARGGAIYKYSMLLLFLNTFCMIPVGFPFAFFKRFRFNWRRIRIEIEKDLPLSSYTVFVTKSLQFVAVISLMVGIIFFSFLFSLFVTTYLALGLKFEMSQLLTSMGPVWALFLLYPYASLTKFLFTPPKEAEIYLSLSSRFITKYPADSTILFDYSLQKINETLLRERGLCIPKSEDAIKMLNVIERIDPKEHRKILKTHIDKILLVIKGRQIEKLPTVISNFINEEELAYTKEFESPILTKRENKKLWLVLPIILGIAAIPIDIFREHAAQIISKNWPIFLLISLWLSVLITLYAIAARKILREFNESYLLSLSLFYIIKKERDGAKNRNKEVISKKGAPFSGHTLVYL